MVRNHPEISKDNVEEILKQGVGKVFVTVLDHASVYKRDKDGKEAFCRFMRKIERTLLEFPVKKTSLIKRF